MLCFAHVSSINTLSLASVNRRLPHDVASVPKEALLCRFPESAP